MTTSLVLSQSSSSWTFAVFPRIITSLKAFYASLRLWEALLFLFLSISPLSHSGSIGTPQEYLLNSLIVSILSLFEYLLNPLIVSVLSLFVHTLFTAVSISMIPKIFVSSPDYFKPLDQQGNPFIQANNFSSSAICWLSLPRYLCCSLFYQGMLIV